MRVAMDVSALSDGLRSGTAVYLYRLARALGMLEDGLELQLLYNGKRGGGADLAESLAGPRVSVLVAPLLWKPLPAPLFWRPYPGRLTEAARGADVFHVGEFVFPSLPPGRPVTATVHDCTTKLFPEWHAWANRLLHHRRLRWIARHASRIIIDAEATRKDTARVLGIPAGRCDVIPLARGTEPDAPGEADVRTRLGLGDDPFVLFVGTLEPRKNLTRLVEAFLSLPERHHSTRLVLAGAWGWHSSELRRAVARAGSRVVATGGLEQPTLNALYHEARAFAYPSLYEGFGLPLLEAMAAGVPVITSRGGTLEEVAGGAALLADPTNVADIAAALDRVLTSEELRRELRERGRKREAEFTWEKTARLTLEVWRRAAGRAA